MRCFKIVLILISCIIFATNINAKEKNKLKRNDAEIRIGASFGVPAGAIPTGASGMPLPAVSMGLFYDYQINPKWSLQIGAESYSMKARFETPYERFEYIGNVEKYINGDEASSRIDTVFLDKATVEGGRFNNRYLAIPISAQYHFRKGWSISFGSYVAYNLKKEMKGTAKDIYFGEKEDPEISLRVYGTMPFNESDKIKDWDFGLNVGGNYELRSGLNFDLRINAGMIDFFVKEFTAPPSAYRNIVLQTTIGYKIGGGYRRL